MVSSGPVLYARMKTGQEPYGVSCVTIQLQIMYQTSAGHLRASLREILLVHHPALLTMAGVLLRMTLPML